MDECKERREAELEFVASAYSPEEAWCETDTNAEARVHRRLDLVYENNPCIQVRLSLTLPPDYPVGSALKISATREDSKPTKCPPHLQKLVLDSLPDLLASCREVATENLGEEAVFLVFNRAEEWVQEKWPEYCSGLTKEKGMDESTIAERRSSDKVILGRRLIYSHHIISKIKRADIRALAADYGLTGYMKIGWPGLLIIEGQEEDCESFYDEIRPWSWQYLVVRGEQHETIVSGKTLDSERRFEEFLEVDDMSLVAQHCRKVGLEALFRTSMKVYDNDVMSETPESSSQTSWYGALVHVDHMNDGKGYRKWLRKTSRETDCLLLIKQCYKNNDYTNRPKIFVGLIGDTSDVSSFMKRWRMSRVDLDGKGKPCLERQMSIIVEGGLDTDPSCAVNWEETMSEECVTTSDEQLASLCLAIGGTPWNQAYLDILGR